MSDAVPETKLAGRIPLMAYDDLVAPETGHL